MLCDLMLGKPVPYRIEIAGRLDSMWVKNFEDLYIRYIENRTVITGGVFDQASLHGLLNRIRDLNLILLTVQRQDPS